MVRDIGGSDPERMAAPKVANYMVELFKNSANVKVISTIQLYSIHHLFHFDILNLYKEDSVVSSRNKHIYSEYEYLIVYVTCTIDCS